MKRMMMIIAGSYAALLAVIAGLSWALLRERRRRCLPVPEIPEGVRREVTDVASRAAAVAADVNSFASRTADEAKVIARKAAQVLR